MPNKSDDKCCIINKMNQSDIEAVATLEKETFSEPWSAKSLTDELPNPTSLFFTAVYNGEFAGYIGANNISDEVYINNIAVYPHFRRLGIASRLLEQVILEAQTKKSSFLTLEVRESNNGAIALYKRYGFVEMGIRPRFYEKPEENAVIMTRIL